MDQERNMKFMQIAMTHLPEAKQLMEQKGLELSMEDIQPMLNMLMKVMNDAYDLGKSDAENQ
ncbi:ComZ family protein [Pseudalkalibacillus berkeleyi]|uniref:ComZ family protein n=1 Tax=Pseudalkalibacillus berkeleyi TaxID=1069813 RepID=A0ABS9GYE0_9BACL|nr:ComZ family protein [Pseudalkalibacillus berkeleyi]MCF6136831.1 ComZ family protein [Pseudalkalibacillus berkeleyi]